MTGDLKIINRYGTLQRHIAAGATRFRVGEPMLSNASPGSSGGVSDSNDCAPAAVIAPLIGLQRFVGISMKDAVLNPFSGAVVDHFTDVAMPFPSTSIIRGKGSSAIASDTDAEILALIGDYMFFTYSANGSVIGTPLFSIGNVPASDASALEIIDGNAAKGTLDVTIDFRAFRYDVT